MYACVWSSYSEYVHSMAGQIFLKHCFCQGACSFISEFSRDLIYDMVAVWLSWGKEIRGVYPSFQSFQAGGLPVVFIDEVPIPGASILERFSGDV